MLTMRRLKIFALCFGISVLMIGLNFIEIRKWTQQRAVSIYKHHLMTKSTTIRTNGTVFQNFSFNASSKILSLKKIVIIVAYMRTGSSLTGSVLEEYPGTFYLFEPIRTVWEKFEDSPNNSVIGLTYPNSSKRIFPKIDHEPVVMDEIKSWMTCNLGDLSMNSLTDSFHRQYTKIMKRLQLCAVQRYRPYHERFVKFGSPYTRFRNDFWNICLDKTSEKCREAPMIVLKFIRLPVRMLKELLPLFPNLKIIHLNRDPRGIFNSRSKIGRARERTTPAEIQKHCQLWAENLQICKNLTSEYPDRIKSIKYENIAESPFEVFKELSDFVGIPFTKEMVDYVTSMTSARKDGCHYCQQRKNSTITALKWRRQLNFTYANFIYETCKYGNEIFKYRHFLNANDMKNLSIPFYS